jgi:phospholipase/carboxylesterase
MSKSQEKLDYIVRYNFNPTFPMSTFSGIANPLNDADLNLIQSDIDLTIIWLHGLGADYNDFLPIIDQFQVSKKIQFIFPNAPLRPITINGGYMMRAWYDISSLVEIDQFFDYSGVMDSVTLINQIIMEQVQNGIDPSKIVIAGFSQGGVVSYFTHLTTQYKLAGTIALSGYLPIFTEEFKLNLSKVNEKSSIFIAHGKDDLVVPYMAGERAYRILSDMGYLVSWYSYPIGHSVSDHEILDLSKWITNLI